MCTPIKCLGRGATCVRKRCIPGEILRCLFCRAMHCRLFQQHHAKIYTKIGVDRHADLEATAQAVRQSVEGVEQKVERHLQSEMYVLCGGEYWFNRCACTVYCFIGQCSEGLSHLSFVSSSLLSLLAHDCCSLCFVLLFFPFYLILSH